MILEAAFTIPLLGVLLYNAFYCRENIPEIIWVRVMVFNAFFNNISVILWWSVLLFEETVSLTNFITYYYMTINISFICLTIEFQGENII